MALASFGDPPPGRSQIESAWWGAALLPARRSASRRRRLRRSALQRLCFVEEHSWGGYAGSHRVPVGTPRRNPGVAHSKEEAGTSPVITVTAQVLLAVSPFILDHSASCASLFCCLLSASRLNCSLDHQAKHVSPIMNAETSPFCSSRRREVPLLITRWPRQSLM